MPEPTRPLLVIPPARSALLRLSSGGGGKQAQPTKSKLVQRLEPKFAVLQHVLELRKAELAASPEGFAPEQILVFETTAPSASSLVAALKETPSLSWLAASSRAFALTTAIEWVVRRVRGASSACRTLMGFSARHGATKGSTFHRRAVAVRQSGGPAVIIGGA